MSRIGTPLLTLSVLAFVASTLAYALWPVVPAPQLAGMGLAAAPPPVDLAWLFLHPRDFGMGALLATVWLALFYHLLRLWLDIRGRAQAGRAADPAPRDPRHRHRSNDGLAEHGPLILALLVGAVWPWLLAQQPVAGFMLSAVTLAGTLAAALRGVRLGGVVKRSSTLGFVAGWALLACLTVFAGLLQQRLGVPQTMAVGIAMLIGAVAAVSVQLRMPRRIGFSVALIWGLIGIAASTVSSNATIATATVVAIAIIAVALVRVTT